MECKPISSLEELLTWEKEDSHCPTVLLNRPFASFDANGRYTTDISNYPRMLVCHDMKGGYLEDRFHEGHDDCTSYTFYHWPQIDEFVYFSHHFVTVPPCGWVDAAHTHGVPIYGTIITESAAGRDTCRRLLHSPATVDAAVDRLLAMSLHYGLDGWLLNIENEVEPAQLAALRYLVAQLTMRMHEAVPHSRVIWYDSVTKGGTLHWQDELNDENECYFHLCDGIFLNYGWSPSGLVRSRLRAADRPNDVYVGVDVFGRGCMGGGGFNVVRPVAEARWLGLSSALFAPGWTHQRLGAARFSAAEDVLWSRLSALLGARGPSALPLHTNFCQGRGHRRYASGQVTSDRPWHRLSAQGLQPSHQQRQPPPELELTDADGRPVQSAFTLLTAAQLTPQSRTLLRWSDAWTAEQCRILAVCAAGDWCRQTGWQVHHTMADGFSGGGCLRVSNDSDTGSLFRLFACDLVLGSGQRPLGALYALKATPAAAASPADVCAICVDVVDPRRPGLSRHVLAGDECAAECLSDLAAGSARLLVHGPVPADRLAARLPGVALPPPGSSGWQLRHFLPPLDGDGDGRRLVSAGVYLSARSTVLLGYLALHQSGAEPDRPADGAGPHLAALHPSGPPTAGVPGPAP